MRPEPNAQREARLDQALRALGWRSPLGDREEWIRTHARDKVARWLSDAGLSVGSTQMSDVLRVAADKLRITIVHVESDEALDRVVNDYAQRQEGSVAALAREFEGSVEAGIVRLNHAQPWERPLVAVVDARGERAAAQVFSACHEVSHALLEPQLELSFRCREGSRDPLERIVDCIAGEIAFFEPIAKAILLDAGTGGLTFGAIEQFRQATSPRSSLTSTCAAAVRMWPTSALWLVASPRAGKHGRDLGAPPLRVEKVGQNGLARSTDLMIPPNYRVPTTSVIHQAFDDPRFGAREAIENLAAWKTTTGGVLSSRMVRVSARRIGPVVFALIEAQGPRLVSQRGPVAANRRTR